MIPINLAKFGEDTAVNFLKSRGYQILKRNFHYFHGEIDVVAIDKDTLVFVEIKTRINKDFGPPEEAITKRKLNLIARTGQFYKSFHQNLPDLLRIDGVFLELDDNNQIKRMELLKNLELP